MTIVEDTSTSSTSRAESRQKKLFRAVKPIITSTGLVRVPCGVCPVRCLNLEMHTTLVKLKLLQPAVFKKKFPIIFQGC